MSEINKSLTRSDLEWLLGRPVTKNYVKVNNEDLTNAYKALVDSNGSEDFLRFYDSIEHMEKAGSKDFGRLQTEERTVMRNGKPMKTKIYVDPDSKEDSNPLDSGSQSGGSKSPSPMVATDLHRGYTFADTDDKDESHEVKQKLPKDLNLEGFVGSSQFTKQSDNVLVYTDDEGTVQALAGFSKQGSYLVLDYVTYSPMVAGAYTNAMYELIAKALQNGLGAKYPIPDEEDISPKELMALEALAENYGLLNTGSCYVGVYEDMAEQVGMDV